MSLASSITKKISHCETKSAPMATTQAQHQQQPQQKVSSTAVKSTIEKITTMTSEKKLAPSELPCPKKDSTCHNNKTLQQQTITTTTTTKVIKTPEKSIDLKMAAMKLSGSVDSVPKEYPDSEDEAENEKEKEKEVQKPQKSAKKKGPLQYGTISNWQAENLEKLYKTYDRFPTSDAVKKFMEKYQISQTVVEIWLETRRELTYRKYLARGLDTEPSVIKFYTEATKMAEGVRLEQPAIRCKSFFSVEGINAIEAKKELEEKEQPSIDLSTNKLFMNPNKEEKCQIVIKNDGEVNIVYQIMMINSENYIMSPICAILHPDEELTLNITRKPGPLDDEFFRIDYGRNIDGVIDARVSANRGYLTQREIVQVVAIDEREMKMVR